MGTSARRSRAARLLGRAALCGALFGGTSLGCGSAPVPALTAAGVGGVGGADGAAAPSTRAALWDLAPTGASAGAVVRDGGLLRALDLAAGFGSVPVGPVGSTGPGRAAGSQRGGSADEPQRRALAPIISVDGWAAAGLDPALGAAAFVWPTRERGAVLVLPVRDRLSFRDAFRLKTSVQGGLLVEELGNGYVCAPAAGRYLCALSVEEIAGAAAPHDAYLARAEARLPAADHGDVELYASHTVREVARLRDAVRKLGLVTGVAASLDLRPDGLSARLHVLGETVSREAVGLAGAPPPADFAPTAAAAPSVARIHVDLAALLSSETPPDAPLDPKLRSEFIDQLTGDFEVATSGSGVASASVVAGLKDPARVERYVKERCAATGGSERRYGLGRIAVKDHGCGGAFIPAMLLMPVALSSVDVSIAVEGSHAVILIGEARIPTAPERDWATLVDGDAARHALADAAALVAFTRSPMLGPEVSPAKAFKVLVPWLDDRTMAFIDAWDEVGARIYQAYATAKVEPDGVVVSADLTTFAGDPHEARDAYEAALALRTAGNEPGYKAALAHIEQAFPGTRAARRAAEVRGGAPYLGAGVLLLAALGRLAPKK